MSSNARVAIDLVSRRAHHRSALLLAVIVLATMAVATLADATGGIAAPGGALVPPGPSAVVVPSAGCTGPQAQSGDKMFTLEVGDIQRQALVHLPPAARGGPAPMLLAFHGSGGSGPFMARYSGLAALADSAGFIAVFPSAAGTRHNWTLRAAAGAPRADDDVAFVRALIGWIEQRRCVDLHRVSAAGVSNGGGFTARLACEMNDVLAGVVVVAGGFFSQLGATCDTDRPISVLEIHGDADQIVPYLGRAGGAGAVRPWVDDWVRRDRCRTTPTESVFAPRVTRLRWFGCGDGSVVEHLRIASGRHQWPGAVPPDPGPPATFSAAQETWRFLAARHLADAR